MKGCGELLLALFTVRRQLSQYEALIADLQKAASDPTASIGPDLYLKEIHSLNLIAGAFREQVTDLERQLRELT